MRDDVDRRAIPNKRRFPTAFRRTRVSHRTTARARGNIRTGLGLPSLQHTRQALYYDKTPDSTKADYDNPVVSLSVAVHNHRQHSTLEQHLRTHVNAVANPTQIKPVLRERIRSPVQPLASLARGQTRTPYVCMSFLLIPPNRHLANLGQHTGTSLSYKPLNCLQTQPYSSHPILQGTD